jgi:hypothetical protein
MTQQETISVLMSVKLPETIGIGEYADTAAYKFCNGDISETTDGLSSVVVDAIASARELGLDWEDFGY